METINYEEWSRVRIQIGEITAAERVEGSEKLFKLAVDFGTREIGPKPEGEAAEQPAEQAPERDLRTVVSGIAPYFEGPEQIVGKKCAFVTNLAPRKLMGIESQGMILAAHDGEAFSLLEVSPAIGPGAKIN